MPEVTPHRIAANEVFIRDLNESIAEKTQEFAGEGAAPEHEHSEFLCACGRPECSETVTLSLEEFERAHSRDDRFVVALGHVVPEVDEVVEHRDDYLVVQKKPGYKPHEIT